MHMRGEPADMQRDPQYDDVVAEVRAFLTDRGAACSAAGIARERLCVDPGFGFGKTTAHNLAAAARAAAIRRARAGRCSVGLSRKSLLAALTGRTVAERLAGSLALATIAALYGARIVRAHDVAVDGGCRCASAMRCAPTRSVAGWVESTLEPMASAAASEPIR